jgi:hypothetical protein
VANSGISFTITSGVSVQGRELILKLLISSIVDISVTGSVSENVNFYGSIGTTVVITGAKHYVQLVFRSLVWDVVAFG